eukprot:145467-Pleurochrysis_carterae.AAC.1
MCRVSYGHSTGTPCEANLYADAKAALALLRDAFHLQPERDVVLYGKSIGSCPTCYLAGRNLVRGVIVVRASTERPKGSERDDFEKQRV